MAPLKIGANTLVAISGISMPTNWERPVRRLAATGSTRYPSVLAAFNTRLATDGTTIEHVAGLSARDTVETCTPAASATCFIASRAFPFSVPAEETLFRTQMQTHCNRL